MTYIGDRRSGKANCEGDATGCAGRGDAPVRQKHFSLHSLRNSRGFMFQPRLRRVPVVTLQQAAHAFVTLDRAVPRRGRVRFRRSGLSLDSGR